LIQDGEKEKNQLFLRSNLIY